METHGHLFLFIIKCIFEFFIFIVTFDPCSVADPIEEE